MSLAGTNTLVNGKGSRQREGLSQLNEPWATNCHNRGGDDRSHGAAFVRQGLTGAASACNRGAGVRATAQTVDESEEEVLISGDMAGLKRL